LDLCKCRLSYYDYYILVCSSRCFRRACATRLQEVGRTDVETFESGIEWRRKDSAGLKVVTGAGAKRRKLYARGGVVFEFRWMLDLHHV